MNSRSLIFLILEVVVFLSLHILILGHLSVGSYAFSYAYLGAVLLMPISANPVRIMLFSLLVGLLADSYYNSIGIHMASCVLLAFLRSAVLNWVVPAGGYEPYMRISIPSMGIKWYLSYMLPLLFCHHLLLFVIDHANLSQFPLALTQAIASTAFTFFSIMFIQLSVEGTRM
jgi:hypothetical protein